MFLCSPGCISIVINSLRDYANVLWFADSALYFESDLLTRQALDCKDLLNCCSKAFMSVPMVGLSISLLLNVRCFDYECFQYNVCVLC